MPGRSPHGGVHCGHPAVLAGHGRPQRAADRRVHGLLRPGRPYPLRVLVGGGNRLVPARRPGRLGHAGPFAAAAGALAPGTRPPGRAGAAAPHPGGPAAGARTDRPGDARRARPPHLAADPARRGAGVLPAGRPRGGRQGGRDHPQQRLPGRGGAAGGDRGAAQRRRRRRRRTPAAHPDRPAGPGRPVPAGRHAGGHREPARRPRCGPGRDRPPRLPHRPGRADQRPQARARRRGPSDDGRSPGNRADGRGPQSAAPKRTRSAGPRRRRRAGRPQRAGGPGPGWLEHGPTPDGDFRLRAWLPWPL
jgi:hypothetical protein